MTGTAIISLDCEGRWGVADHLTPKIASGLTDERLKFAYRSILGLFRRYDIAATFAFVELFTRARSRATTDTVRELADELPYLAAAAKGLGEGDEGWVGDWALDMVGKEHEIAFHGATHVPWTDLTPEQARRELEMTPPDRRQTMVFPRNRIAHLDVLEAAGCRGYRGAREVSSRAASLLSEFNMRELSQSMPAPANPPAEIASGIFVNWRSGLRRVVPPQVTRLRARHLLEDAGRRGGVAHFWLHPENVASAPGTLGNLEAIVEEIQRARDSGEIAVQTQLACCARLQSEAASGLCRARPHDG